MAADSLARIAPARASRTAAAQAPSAVSIARTRMTLRPPASALMHDPEKWEPVFEQDHAQRRRAALNRPNLGHVGHEMAQQVLNAVLERRGGGRAARARA